MVSRHKNVDVMRMFGRIVSFTKDESTGSPQTCPQLVDNEVELEY